MTLVRAGFLAVLLLAAAGFGIGRYVVSSLSGQAPQVSDTAPTSSPRPTATVRPTAPPAPAAIRLPTVTPTPRPTATPIHPAATPATGTVTLVRYWLAETAARRGQTVGIGYVINNGTGRTVRLMLGASIKSVRVRSWLRSISDPAHDILVAVRPGITTYQRLFHLVPSLRPGNYDVAWGLRATNGARVALVTAPSTLTVRR